MFDSTTQILTSDGWIAVPNITPDHRIAQFDPVDASLVSYELPLGIQEHDYAGSLLSIDGCFLVTHDQLLYTSLSYTSQRRYQPQFELRPANEGLIGRYAGKQLWQAGLRVRRAGTGTRLIQQHFSPFTKLSPVEFARLTGFFLGDGFATKKSSHKIRFQLTKLRKTNYLAAICDRLHLFLATRKKMYFSIKYADFGKWFASQCYVPKTSVKTMPPILLERSQEVLLALLDGLRHSDGHSYTSQRWQYATTSPHLAALVQAVGVVAGIPFSCHPHEDCYRLYRLVQNDRPHLNDFRTANTVTEVPYTGMVYDVQTRTGLIAIRRENKTLLIGTG